jgi:class 3 adenylate cyclase/TolB-like protein
MKPHERSLATVLFTDIVGSTERAAELRDTGWRDLRQEHDRRVRRELKRFGGHEINTAGDSFLATFERPARAIACAGAIRTAVRELELEIRAGLHMGEVEGAGRALGGLALNIGARVAAEAAPGEILVSRSVHDALAGSAFDFEDRGVRALKGVPGEWRLFAVTGVPEEAAHALPGRWSANFLGRWKLVSGALVGAVLLGAAALYMSRREAAVALNPEEALAADADPGIAVLPFTVHDSDLARWREGMVDLLSVNLDGVPGLRAIDNRTILARWGNAVPDTARADLATALAVARATGARYALLGSVVAAGTELRLTADVYAVKDGTKLGQAQVAGAPDSILVLVDRLSMEIVRVLPREEAVLADMDLTEITTDSLDALKAFLNGEALYRRADFPGAAAEYEHAIASDSMFAFAWDRLLATCGWGARSELCERQPKWTDEFLSRLPARKAELVRATRVVRLQGPAKGIGGLRELVRKYPDDSEAWYQLGEFIFHFGDAARVDRADGYRALERAIALAPTTSAEPYIHLMERAFADADSTRVAGLLEAYERITHGAGDPDHFRLAFNLGLGDPATRVQAHATVDTMRTPILTEVILHLGNPRLHEASQEALRVLLARPDHRDDWVGLFLILYPRGKVRAALDVLNDPVIGPAVRAAWIYRLYQAGAEIPPEELERILAAGAADTTAGRFPAIFPSTFLWVGAYAVDRGNWEEYAAALDRQRARARGYLAQGDSLNASGQEAAARALEGYALWKGGQKAQAIRLLETAQQPLYGYEWGLIFGPNFTVRGWLGELMLEVDRPRDAERYFKSLDPPGLSRDPFTALWLAKVYEELGEFEKARESYEYALLSWQDADPEMRPRIEATQQALERLPKSLRRESP